MQSNQPGAAAKFNFLHSILTLCIDKFSRQIKRSIIESIEDLSPESTPVHDVDPL